MMGIHKTVIFFSLDQPKFFRKIERKIISIKDWEFIREMETAEKNDMGPVISLLVD